MIMFISIVATSCIGYGFGWIRGYEQKDKDYNQIKKEMDHFWEEVDKRGI